MGKISIFIVISAISVAVAAGGWFLVKKTRGPSAEVPIRIFESTGPNQWEIVKKLTGRDILTEEGVRLEPVHSVSGGGGGTTALQALLANNVDVAGSAWPAWVNIVAGGGKIKAVLGTSVSTKNNKSGKSGLLVLEGSSVHTIKDLVGKRIAVNVLGAEADYVIREYLKQNGLSIDQVQLVVVPGENQQQMLRSKQVDAAAWTSTGGAQWDMTVEKGGVREIPGTKNFDVKGETVFFGTGFRNDFIAQHPDTVRKYVRASDAARRLVYDEFQKDPERVKKAYADIAIEKGGNPLLARYYEGSSWTPKFPFIADKDIQWWIDRFSANGQLKPGQIKPSDVYTNEFNPKYKKN